MFAEQGSAIVEQITGTDATWGVSAGCNEVCKLFRVSGVQVAGESGG